MNTLQDFFNSLLHIAFWFLLAILALLGILFAVIFYEERLTKYHFDGKEPLIYHADYLDKFENTNGKMKYFLVKHSVFNQTTCDEVKDWIQNHVDKNKLHDTVEVYEYDNDIKEGPSWLKNEYDALLFGLDLCRFDKGEFRWFTALIVKLS